MYGLKKIGTDTEIFLKDKDGKSITAIGLIGGTKQKPRAILDKLGSAVQEDNVMCEFNTPPAENGTQWVGGINKVLAFIIDELKTKGIVIDIVPSVEFDSLSLAHPQAMHMGCDPDFSAWTLEQNPQLDPSVMKNIRTAGGHIHVSFSYRGGPPNRIQMMNVIRMMDLTLGVPSVILDTDDRRRNYYGIPGAHRVKAEDRVEYRTLSNFWIKNDTLKEWAYNNTVDAIRRLNRLGSFGGEELWGTALEKDILQCIRTSDRKLAARLVATSNVQMP